jgi:DNA polymerase-4
MAPAEAEQGAAVTDEISRSGAVPDAGIAGITGPAGAARSGEIPAATAHDEAQARGDVTRDDVTRDAAMRDDALRPERLILHVDIDAFFAAIEQQRDPRLAGRPVIVGAGVIASCSYEARRFGLKAGMPLSEAKRLCPEAVIVEGHAQVYRCFAEQIFARCREISPAVETYLDEAYCDLSGTERLHGEPLAAVAALKRDIRAVTGLGVTCGLGPNRMLAKLIGKTVKPDGLAQIEAREAHAFLTARPIEQLAGVGHSHARTLRSMNLNTIGDLRALPADTLEALFGAPGRLLHQRCRGFDTAVVSEREVPLTISRETSFHRDTAERVEIEGMLEYLASRACRAARELGLRARTVALRLRYTDGESAERARSLAMPSDADPPVVELARTLLAQLFTRRVALHAIGVTLSSFTRTGIEQGSLFDEPEAGRQAALYHAFDVVREAYGHGVLVSGHALHLKGRLEEDRHGFVLRTPSLTR